jgi:hypothetical protein
MTYLDQHIRRNIYLQKLINNNIPTIGRYQTVSHIINQEIKLNLISLIMDKSRSYALFKKMTPMYWYTRPMTRFLIENKKEILRGAEIGVEYGLNAKTMLRLLPIEKLYLIDPYENKPGTYSGDQCFEETKRFLRKYTHKVEFIRKTSIDAAQDIPGNLDFIYIDGNHEYEAVKKDIEVYYPKVKQGGIIGGHDFWASETGVCKAVLEFASANNLRLSGKFTDWWIIKK